MTAILKIALPGPFREALDYLPTEHTDIGEYLPGQRVLVPLQRRRGVVGTVLETTTTSKLDSARLRRVEQVIDQQPVLPELILRLCQWLASYYQAPIGEAIQLAMPVMLRRGKPCERASESGFSLTGPGFNTDAATLPQAQARALEFMQQHQRASSRHLRELRLRDHAIPALERRGLVVRVQIPIATETPDAPTERPPPLTDEQAVAVESMSTDLSGFNTTLLQGITGSGKTEVYLRLIEQVIAHGRQAMVLVPEISITPQLLARFRNRLGNCVQALHSGLSNRERLNRWVSCTSGTVSVLIGTRSAVLTPVPNLGLIIVDEEHDALFKQEHTVRYSARDTAIMRAKLHDIPVVLGSATPSLESWYSARSMRYRHVHLTRRATGVSKPHISLVDTRQQELVCGLAPASIEALRQTLSEGYQAMLFRDRRGYAPILLCPNCGWLAECGRCDARMTLHRASRLLRCHYCEASRIIPPHCPTCTHRPLQTSGEGTEQIEESLKQLFPEHEVVRIDRDRVRNQGDLERQLRYIHSGTPALLIGTRMLAKGHDIANLKLVVAMQADQGIFNTDFRACEQSCQLLLQVAGRAGRARTPGRVLIQTTLPEHPLMQLLVSQDYNRLAEYLLNERQQTGMPPLTHMAILRADATQLNLALQLLQRAANQCRSRYQGDTLRIIGPLPSYMARRANRYHALLQLCARQRPVLQQLLAELVTWLQSNAPSKVRWAIDVDPLQST